MRIKNIQNLIKNKRQINPITAERKLWEMFFIEGPLLDRTLESFLYENTEGAIPNL